MSNTSDTIPRGVINRIESRYSQGSKYHDLFLWLWDELKSIHPEAVCRATERYIGFYPSERNRKIFAYVDPQNSGLFIGVFESVFKRLDVRSFGGSHFPDWNPSGKLVGLLLQERNPEMIQILSAAIKARVAGVWTVQPISHIDAEVERLLPVVERDLQSLVEEEERFEGERGSRHSNYYERDPALRARAITIHGTTCMVENCAFNFQKVYGDRGEDYIEVHHLNPLSAIDPETKRRTNPQSDMAVVCANCHRMIHRRRNSILSLTEVSELIACNK